jgi:hypothetical protein
MRRVGDALIHANGQTDRHTDRRKAMTNVVADFFVTMRTRKKTLLYVHKSCLCVP